MDFSGFDSYTKQYYKFLISAIKCRCSYGNPLLFLALEEETYSCAHFISIFKRYHKLKFGREATDHFLSSESLNQIKTKINLNKNEYKLLKWIIYTKYSDTESQDIINGLYISILRKFTEYCTKNTVEFIKHIENNKIKKGVVHVNNEQIMTGKDCELLRKELNNLVADHELHHLDLSNEEKNIIFQIKEKDNSINYSTEHSIVTKENEHEILIWDYPDVTKFKIDKQHKTLYLMLDTLISNYNTYYRETIYSFTIEDLIKKYN